MKTRTGQKLKLTTVEELLGVPASESSTEIDIDVIHMFKNHPFKVLDDEKMSDLVESIRVNGILSPVLVRPDGEDSYEMISGHRRMHAAKIVGLTMIPAIVREMSDDEAMSQQSNADAISKVQNLNFKKSKIRTSKSPKNQLLGVQNMDHNNTYNNKTNNNQTDDSNQIISGDDNRFDQRYDAESEFKAYQSLIKENIEYEYLLIAYPTEKETIEGIYELIVETVMTSSEKILIASNWYPASLVKSKFMKLNYHHIQYVLDMLRSNTTKVRNIKKYILASLFNATTTIDSYYRAEVNHDFPQYAAAK